MGAHQPSPTLAMGCTRPYQESLMGGKPVYTNGGIKLCYTGTYWAMTSHKMNDDTYCNHDVDVKPAGSALTGTGWTYSGANAKFTENVVALPTYTASGFTQHGCTSAFSYSCNGLYTAKPGVTHGGKPVYTNGGIKLCYTGTYWAMTSHKMDDDTYCNHDVDGSQ